MSKPIYKVVQIGNPEILFKGTSGEVAKAYNTNERNVRKIAKENRIFSHRYHIIKTTETTQNVRDYNAPSKSKKISRSTVLPKRRNSQTSERKERIEETAGLREMTIKETIVNKHGFVITNTYTKDGVLLRTFAYGKEEHFSHLLNQ